jgi:hypothetical protein
MVKGVGGVIGCIAAGLITEYSHPKWCWLIESLFGIFIIISALFLTKESEQNLSHF